MKKVGILLLVFLVLFIFTSNGPSIISGTKIDITPIDIDLSSDDEVIESYGNITELRTDDLKGVTFKSSTYKVLNKNQKEIYKMIYLIAQKMPEGLVKLYQSYDDVTRDISIAYNAVLTDFPEVFWMPYTYIVTKFQQGKNTFTAIALDYHLNGKDLSYAVTIAERDSMQGVIDKRVKEILSSAKPLKTNFEKEKFFNDYICSNTEYVTDDELGNTAYGALINGKAQCEGYARAFQLLCKNAGIECDLVCGSAYGQGHVWNALKDGDNYNFVDVTWNDKSDYRSYIYFKISKSQMEYDHVFAPLYSDVADDEISKGSFNYIEWEPSATGNSYYEKTGRTLSYGYSKKTADIITQDYNNGEYAVEFMFTDDDLLYDYQNDESGFLSNIQSYLSGITLKQYIFYRDILIIFYE